MLGILAGSSMSGHNVSPNAGEHEPGSSVDDSIWDQIKHVGKMAEEVGEAIIDSIAEIFD